MVVSSFSQVWNTGKKKQTVRVPNSKKNLQKGRLQNAKHLLPLMAIAKCQGSSTETHGPQGHIGAQHFREQTWATQNRQLRMHIKNDTDPSLEVLGLLLLMMPLLQFPNDRTRTFCPSTTSIESKNFAATDWSSYGLCFKPQTFWLHLSAPTDCGHAGLSRSPRRGSNYHHPVVLYPNSWAVAIATLACYPWDVSRALGGLTTCNFCRGEGDGD